MLDPNAPNPSVSAEVNSAQFGTLESPLADQLPIWDLLPPHTLLVRRRPAHAFSESGQLEAPGGGLKAASPPRPSNPPPTTDAASPPECDSFCTNCGSRLEEEATFCTECGTKAG